MSLLDKIKGKKTAEPIVSDKPADAVLTEEKKSDKPAVVKREPTVKAKAEKSAARNWGVYGVLVSPLITEKSAREEQHNKYAFAVAVTATKDQIAKAVETRYGVKPVKINVSNQLGKTKRLGRRLGKQKDTRKAIVTLAKGKSINVYEAK